MGMFLTAAVVLGVAGTSFAGSFEIAKKSLESNIVRLRAGSFLSAGGHQFKSFWTRDFCFSSRGLLAIGRADVVKSHLNYLLDHRRTDDLVPLYVDSMRPVDRVILGSVARDLDLDVGENVKPFYLVNNKLEAIDSNIMVLYAAQLYAKTTGDQSWFLSRQKDFRRVFNFYNKKKDGLLIVQGEHADWQDSAKRSGKTFFTNLLYYHMAREYGFLPATELLSLRNEIVRVFYDRQAGLFRSMAGRSNISLDGNLWAIEHNLIANPEILYKNLTQHKLYTAYAFPGFATYPSYTPEDTYIQVKVTGLQEYHGKLYWSWLMAYSAKIAYRMNDIRNYERIRNKVEDIVARDQTVNEIYNNNEELTPFKSLLYQSESPFSWGSAFVLDMPRSE